MRRGHLQRADVNRGLEPSSRRAGVEDEDDDEDEGRRTRTHSPFRTPHWEGSWAGRLTTDFPDATEEAEALSSVQSARTTVAIRSRGGVRLLQPTPLLAPR
jgi:hypothetical protein